MSRKKIKKFNTNKSTKEQWISPRQVMLHNITEERREVKKKDSYIVSDMIADGTLEVESLLIYNYVQEKSKELGWSVGRFNRAIELSGALDLLRKLRNES